MSRVSTPATVSITATALDDPRVSCARQEGVLVRLLPEAASCLLQAVVVEKLVSAPGMGSATTAEQDPVLARDVSRLDALQRHLRTIFWMHRLPVYRARIREIYDSASSGDPTSGAPVPTTLSTLAS